MYKKILAAVAVAFAVSAGASAQSSKADKPAQGTWSAEISFNPFDNDQKTFSYLDYLKVRYFLGDHDALRLRFGFEYDSNKTVDDKDVKDNWEKNTSGDFRVDLGWEHHWDVSSRTNLYAGAQFGIRRHFVSAKTSDKSGDKVYEYEYVNRNVSGNDRATFGFVFGGFAGVDVYVYKGLYLGAEIGLNMETKKESETEIPSGTDKVKKSNDDRSSFSAKLQVQPGIRLGYSF